MLIPAAARGRETYQTTAKDAVLPLKVVMGVVVVALLLTDGSQRDRGYSCPWLA